MNHEAEIKEQEALRAYQVVNNQYEQELGQVDLGSGRTVTGDELTPEAVREAQVGQGRALPSELTEEQARAALKYMKGEVGLFNLNPGAR